MARAFVAMKAGDTITLPISKTLPTGSAWQARFAVRDPCAVQPANPVASGTIALSESPSGTWTGTLVIPATVTDKWRQPERDGDHVFLPCDVLFHESGGTQVHSPTFDFRVDYAIAV